MPCRPSQTSQQAASVIFQALVQASLADAAAGAAEDEAEGEAAESGDCFARCLVQA